MSKIGGTILQKVDLNHLQFQKYYVTELLASQREESHIPVGSVEMQST